MDELFQHESTLDQMLQLDEPEIQSDYRLGIGHHRARHGYVGWGHDGVWGAAMYYFPDSDISIAFTQNQVDGDPVAYVDSVMSLLERHGLRLVKI